MGTFGVVVAKPSVEVNLQSVNPSVDGFAHLDAKELIEHSTVKRLKKLLVFGVLTLILRCSMLLSSK